MNMPRNPFFFSAKFRIDLRAIQSAIIMQLSLAGILVVVGRARARLQSEMLYSNNSRHYH